MYQIIEDRNAWVRALRESGITSVFCHPEMAALFSPGAKLFLFREGAKAAVVVFSLKGANLSGLHYGGVVTNSPDKKFATAVVRALKFYCRSAGVVSCQLRVHPFLNTIKIGRRVGREALLFIDLCRPEKEIMAAVTKQHRRCIARARAGGMKVIYSHDRTYLQVFYKYYAGRLKEKGVVPKAAAFFENMFNAFGEHLLIAVVRDAAQILAVSLLLKDGDDVFMMYGGMCAQGYERYAKHLMIADMIRTFKGQDIARLVLGTGTDGRDQIYRFKRGFTDSAAWVFTYESALSRVAA